MTNEIISSKWKKWISENLNNGVSKIHIFNILLENKFSYETITKELNFQYTTSQTIPSDWQNWIKENILNGVDQNEILQTLIHHGFSHDAVTNYIQNYLASQIITRQGPRELMKIDQSKVAREMPKIPKVQLNRSEKLDADGIDIWRVTDFTSKAECQQLIKLIRLKLKPSKLASQDPDLNFRTSRTCELGSMKHRLVIKIENRICDLLRINHKYSEPIQGQYYEVGEQFKSHTDFFEIEELEKLSDNMGQRTYTVMIYLNDVLEGGETLFPKVRKKFVPKMGDAIIWCNLRPDGTPNHETLHHALPVKNGFKAILTKWFRERASS